MRTQVQAHICNLEILTSRHYQTTHSPTSPFVIGSTVFQFRVTISTNLKYCILASICKHIYNTLILPSDLQNMAWSINHHHRKHKVRAIMHSMHYHYGTNKNISAKLLHQKWFTSCILRNRSNSITKTSFVESVQRRRNGIIYTCCHPRQSLYIQVNMAILPSIQKVTRFWHSDN